MADNKPRILVVDDDRLQLQVISDLLGPSYSIRTASDGSEAIKALEEETFAAVLSDHMMPDITGVEVLAKCLEKQPGAVRMLVTATDDIKALEASVNVARVHRFVIKPVREAELPAIVTGAIREAQLEAENKRLVEELRVAVDELQAREKELERELTIRTQELREMMAQIRNG